MKYKAGDRFIIEIRNRATAQGLYTIKGFNTLVFDDNGLDRLEQVQEHDGCDGCEYVPLGTLNYPCSECKQNYKDKWTPKKNDIQVGDEVEHDDAKLKGVVQRIIDGSLYVLYRGKEYTYMSKWDKEECTRTGKTYPELIKALEELPQEGE